MLNDTEVNKIFWPAESEIKLMLSRCGFTCKTVVVFDCCREDYAKARERVQEAQNALNSEKEKEKKVNDNKLQLGKGIDQNFSESTV